MFFYKQLLIFLSLVYCSLAFVQENNVEQDIDKHVANLRTKSSKAKLSSIVELGKIGPDASSAVPLLIECLSSKNSRIVLRTIRTLQQIGTRGLPDLQEALHRKDKNIQRKILRVLCGIESQFELASFDVVALLQSEDVRVRIYTLNLLERLPSHAAEVVPELSQIIVSEDPEQRMAVVKVFCALGKRVMDMACILHTLRYSDKNSRNLATKALTDPASLALIRKNTHHRFVKKHVLEILKSINYNSPLLMPTIKQAIFLRNDDIQRYIFYILQKKEEKIKEALPCIKYAIAGRKLHIKVMAIKTLAKIGDDALPILEKNYAAGDSRLKMLLLQTLQNISPSRKMTKEETILHRYMDTFAELEKEILSKYGEYEELAISFFSNFPIFGFLLGDQVVLHNTQTGQKSFINLFKTERHKQKVSRRNLHYIAKFKTITRISLIDSDINNEDFQYLVDNLQNLTTLTIFNDHITNLEGIEKLRNLVDLRLDLKSADNIEPLSKLSNLRSLTIHRASKIKDFSPLSKMKKLTSLYLSRVATDHYHFLSPLTNLKYLYIKTSSINDVDLLCLKEMKALSSLDLTYNQIGDPGVAVIPNLVSLKSLDLSGTRITNKSMVMMKNLPKLESLDLSGTKITEEGITSLIKDFPSQLKRLYVPRRVSHQTIRRIEKLGCQCILSR
ncbi:hypothetical protein [Candidatus Uabimicrobium amorphum]|uniref:Uncharacterized protein n=1 Tax=Uabimicrobium amorphum TaxID=2596890 RepID=A0A5S9IRK7_UABAM|nr:hypothetical protein [Candidatus Uabimicrobium amorphum]BBM86833.1 hypothetical protein UABAM_05226 [Candidatus Uabimicrobium amorphum]